MSRITSLARWTVDRTFRSTSLSSWIRSVSTNGPPTPTPAMNGQPDANARRLRRLSEELGEAGLDLKGTRAWQSIILEEVDRALRPRVHEGRVASVGSIIDPTTEPEVWQKGTDVEVALRPVGDMPIA